MTTRVFDQYGCTTKKGVKHWNQVESELRALLLRLEAEGVCLRDGMTLIYDCVGPATQHALNVVSSRMEPVVLKP